MGPGNCPEIPETGLEKEFKRSNGIEKVSYGKDFVKAVVGEVLVKEIKVVPEIEVGFTPGGFGQRSAANVKNDRLGSVHDFIAVVF